MWYIYSNWNRMELDLTHWDLLGSLKVRLWYCKLPSGGNICRKKQRHWTYILSCKTFSLCLFFFYFRVQIFFFITVGCWRIMSPYINRLTSSSSEIINKTTQAKRKYDPDNVKYWYGFTFSEDVLCLVNYCLESQKFRVQSKFKRHIETLKTINTSLLWV